MKKKKFIREYEKVTLSDMMFQREEPRRRSKNLSECIREVFIDTRPKSLDKWLKGWKYETIEPEMLFFIALLCGAHFQIFHPKLEEVLKTLWTHFSLSSHMDIGLDDEIVDLVVAALRPGIEKALAERGYKRGWPNGDYVSEKGKPPEKRGAWVAALLIEEYLKRNKMKQAVATKEAIELIMTLLGREDQEAGLREYYRFRKSAPLKLVAPLVGELEDIHRFVLEQDGLKGFSQDLAPSREEIEKYLAWRSRHISMENTINEQGCYGLCSSALGRIPKELLKPFWEMKVTSVKKEKMSKLAKKLH